MGEAATSVKKLLEPLATTAAKIWLTKKSYIDDSCLSKSQFHVWFIKGYRALNDQGQMPEELSSWIYSRDGSFENISAAEIEDLAEWAGIQKTTHWYTGVGWILYEGLKSARARELLAKAIEMACVYPFPLPSCKTMRLINLHRIQLVGLPWRVSLDAWEIMTKITMALYP